MKKILPLITFLSLAFGLNTMSQISLAPEQDCVNAIPICLGIYEQTISYSGEGMIPNEIDSGPSCLGSGEKNGVWYVFSVTQTGNLGFNLTPLVIADDYDWAMFNVSELRCTDIFDEPSMEVGCNYSGTPGVTGANGMAGAQNEPLIPVSAGEQYVLYVSNFENVMLNGYILDLTISTAQVSGPIQTVDLTNVSAVDGDTITPICGANSITAFFDVSLDCDLLSEEFIEVVDDQGNILPIASIEADCQEIGGGFYSQAFELVFDDPIPDPGNYNITVYSSEADPAFFDVCGNIIGGEESDTLTLDFNVNDVNNLFNFTTFPADCIGESSGIIIGNLSSNEYDESFFDITWDNGATGLTQSNVAAGTYTVSIGAGSCLYTETVMVEEPDQGIELELVETTNACNNSGGVVSFMASGGEGTLLFSLNGEDAIDPMFDDLAPGDYQILAIDNNECSAVLDFTIEEITLDQAIFEDDSIMVCNYEIRTLSSNFSEGYSFSWAGPDGFASSDETVDVGLDMVGTYSLTIMDEMGCSFSADIIVSDENCPEPQDTTIIDAIESVVFESLNLYPNPVTNQLFIDIEHGGLETEISIFNVLGHKLYQTVTSDKNHRVDTKDWTSGVYLVVIKPQSQNDFEVIKIIK